MNVVILDDDQLSRRIIEEMVNKTDGIELVASYANPVDAINGIKQNEDGVDLILLDIEMPDMSGMEFMDSLEGPPQVVIISSKGKYAVDAFEYDVTDYLLKPVTYARFYKAINKAEARHERNRIDKVGKEEIFIKKNSSLVKLKYNEILWIEALENYVIFNTYNDKFTIHFTMKAIEQKLPQKKFIRVHRSYIVNADCINAIEDNSVVINVSEGTKSIPIGKSYKDKLMRDINLMIK